MSYPAFLDGYILASFFLILIVSLESTAVHLLAVQGDVERARAVQVSGGVCGQSQACGCCGTCFSADRAAFASDPTALWRTMASEALQHPKRGLGE
eukprot:3899256-Rhodomonas_salina.2